MGDNKVVGKEGITAYIIADSISAKGDRITTFELEYPRFCHSELMTHRLFSRNAASSRAIPTSKMIKMVWDNPAMPVYWGENQSGMQATRELSGRKLKLVKGLWRVASKIACASSWTLYKLNVHKQLVNRITEPFQRYKVIVTATEYDNWYELRDHKDAQPEIQELAKAMSKASRESDPRFLNVGEWHLPYVDRVVQSERGTIYEVNGKEVSLEDAKKISASCCAQVSYRVLNDSLETATKIYDKLVGSAPRHSSPFEHQATPMLSDEYESFWEDGNANFGVTHADRQGDTWSANFKGWIQNRQLMAQVEQNDERLQNFLNKAHQG